MYIGENQMRVYGGPSMSNTVLTTLGLTNVFADVNKRVTEVSTEELLAATPASSCSPTAATRPASRTVPTPSKRCAA